MVAYLRLDVGCGRECKGEHCIVLANTTHHSMGGPIKSMTDCETFRALGKDMAVTGAITPLDALVSLPKHMDNVMGRFDRIVKIRGASELPVAWILADTRLVNSGCTLTRARDLASIFDGTTGLL